MAPKEEIWLTEYFKTFNATEAARRAGYKWPDKQGAQKKEKFAAEIKQRIDEKAMGADELLTRVAEHARGNLADYIDASGEIDIQGLKDDGLGHLLKKYRKVVKRTITKDGREYETEYTEAELYPADSALDKLMKYHGLYDTKPLLGDKERPFNIRFYWEAMSDSDD